MPGERVVLLGANGSGKSTLARLANGLLLPSEGAVLADDLSTAERETIRSVRRKVGVVAQDPESQIVSSTVQEDVAFGPENLGLPRDQIIARVSESLEAVGLCGYEQRDPHTLSGGEKQRLVIAGVLALSPEYFVLDEPSSMLDSVGRAEVRAVIDRLHRSGHGIVHITHDLEECLSADRVLVLKAGIVVYEGEPTTLLMDEERLADYGLAMTPLLDLAAALSKNGVPLPEDPTSPAALAGSVVKNVTGSTAAVPGKEEHTCAAESVGTVASGEACEAGLSLQEVSFRYARGTALERQALTDISFFVEPGSFTFIVGQTGSGKSTLLRIASGLIPPESGSATVEGNPIEPPEVGLVFQQPESQLFAETVFDDILFGPRNLGLVHSSEESESVVREVLDAVGLDYETFHARSPFSLSGGQARRVAIATVLAMRPRYLLLDEPTAGLDAEGRAFVHALIRKLLSQGVGVVVVSHDIDEFLPRAQKVFLLSRGKGIWSGLSQDLIADPAPFGRAGLNVPALTAFQQLLGAVPGSYSFDPDRIAQWALHGYPVRGCG